MIDIDAIERRCKEATRNGYGKHPVIECASAESLIELITRLRQAEKDAARYRWLRDEAIEHLGSGPLIIFSDFNGEPCSFGDCGSIISHDDADKAIDEAMQCK